MGSSSDGIKCLKKFDVKIVLLIGLLVFVNFCTCHVGDSCDWNGSGLSDSGALDSQQRGVQPLYLRCRQGRIRWSYPSGALRLLLRLQGTEKEFRACIRPGPQFQGARIYLEGHRRIHLLYAPLQQDNEVTESSHRMRCFTSVRGQAALYVEALPQVGLIHNLKKTLAEFSYDLQPLSKAALQDDLDECRPCTDEEVIQYYCSSDYVIRGTVSSLSHDSSQDRSQLEIRVTKVHRDSPSQSVLSTGHDVDDTYVRRAVLYRPLKCGTKFGIGHFLFLARRLLDDPYVICAPRLDQWKVLRRKAIQDGSSPCLLD